MLSEHRVSNSNCITTSNESALSCLSAHTVCNRVKHRPDTMLGTNQSTWINCRLRSEVKMGFINQWPSSALQVLALMLHSGHVTLKGEGYGVNRLLVPSLLHAGRYRWHCIAISHGIKQPKQY